ncbi:hypothetical protein HMPREF1575_00035 [Gardnerella vaginalis JCP7672]|nr:hypothetical protein HMPREF1575_00035 [Gardnerella vaginalis JCP7672]
MSVNNTYMRCILLLLIIYNCGWQRWQPVCNSVICALTAQMCVRFYRFYLCLRYTYLHFDEEMWMAGLMKKGIP